MRSQVQVEINEVRSGIAHQHLRAIEGIRTETVELRAGWLRAVKLVDRHVIAVDPGTEVGIIGEVLPWPRGGIWRSLGRCLESIGVIRARRIAGLRHGDTFEKG